MTAFFFSYWWLVFPLFGMFMGLVGMIGHFRHRTEVLKLLKSYADQGKDPPAALLEAVRSDEDRADDYYHYRRYGRYGRYGRFGCWRQVIVWGALAAGFTYAGMYSHMGEASSIFSALGIAFGVAAFASLIWALISSFTGPKV